MIECPLLGTLEGILQQSEAVWNRHLLSHLDLCVFNEGTIPNIVMTKETLHKDVHYNLLSRHDVKGVCVGVGGGGADCNVIVTL